MAALTCCVHVDSEPGHQSILVKVLSKFLHLGFPVQHHFTAPGTTGLKVCAREMWMLAHCVSELVELIPFGETSMGRTQEGGSSKSRFKSSSSSLCVCVYVCFTVFVCVCVWLLYAY